MVEGGWDRGMGGTKREAEEMNMTAKKDMCSLETVSSARGALRRQKPGHNNNNVINQKYIVSIEV